MRYRVNGVEIRSENAAKPAAQSARYLTDWLGKMLPVDRALDYGCGKLRYAGCLAARSRHLTLVDSEVQVNRVQRLGGEQTTIREFALKMWPNTRVLSVEEFERDDSAYDFTLCSNVLSTIPEEGPRARLLSNILSTLSDVGSCLFVTQFYNSEFRKISKSDRATPHLDGWIVPSLRGYSYYGVLRREDLVELLAAHGYAILNAWSQDQSAYVLVGRAQHRPAADG